jgi:hypothetical protein
MIGFSVIPLETILSDVDIQSIVALPGTALSLSKHSYLAPHGRQLMVKLAIQCLLKNAVSA